MIRAAIIDTKSKQIATVVEYETLPANPPPGFSSDYIVVANESVGPDWIWDGSNLIAPALPVTVPEPQSVMSQDIMAQFTAADATLIQAAIASNVQFWLLWSAMQAQSDPMIVTNARFLAGWSALITVLGQARMTAIATALGITVA